MAGKISVLQLDTQFPRIPGDVACPETYACALDIVTVPKASVSKIVTSRPKQIDIGPFERAMTQARGDLITTSCGFLSYWQEHLAAHTSRPFIASSLSLLAALSQRYAPGEIMILTFDAASLGPQHLGAFPDYASGITGLPETMHLRDVITHDRTILDAKRAEQEIAKFIRSAQRPTHKHILLECTNLPPYRRAIEQATGLPVSDILTAIEDQAPSVIAPEFASKDHSA